MSVLLRMTFVCGESGELSLTPVHPLELIHYTHCAIILYIAIYCYWIHIGAKYCIACSGIRTYPPPIQVCSLQLIACITFFVDTQNIPGDFTFMVFGLLVAKTEVVARKLPIRTVYWWSKIVDVWKSRYINESSFLGLLLFWCHVRKHDHKRLSEDNARRTRQNAWHSVQNMRSGVQ